MSGVSGYIPYDYGRVKMDWQDLGIDDSFEDDDFGPTIIRGKVVGVSFIKGYPENLHRLLKELNEAGVLDAYIKRNPTNKYDANACEVWVGEEMIGHLARDLAAMVAPLIDEGSVTSLTITSIGFAKGDETKPGAGFSLKIL